MPPSKAAAPAAGAAAAPPRPPPPTLVERARTHALKAGEKQYLRSNAAVAAGAGVYNSGFLILLEALGKRGSNMPLVAMGSMTVLQAATAAGGSLYVDYQHRRRRHAAGGAPPPLPEPPKALCWTLVGCGVVDTLQNACLLATTWGLPSRWVPTALVLVVGVLGRAVEAGVIGVAQGTWARLRVHLTDMDADEGHPLLSATAVFMENLLHGLSFNIASIGGFVGSGTFGRGERWLLNQAIALMAAGAAASSISKLYFVLQARNFSAPPGTPAAEADP